MLRDETTASEAANPGYAAGRLAAVLTTSETHADPATRERAREKVAKWKRVLEGMFSGELQVGSRRPNPKAPVWATPEVVTGGFVTGTLLAGGAWQPHELSLLERLALPAEAVDREKLNRYFLSEAGFAELTAWLQSGCYEIVVPEEGALLTVAWLATHGQAEAARELVEVLAPHFAALRFFPVPAQRPASSGSRVHLQSVGATREQLRRIEPRAQIIAQREAIRVWEPLYERMVRMFLETVDGELPAIQPDAQGSWVSEKTGKFFIAGGWPCRTYPPDWKVRAEGILADCAAQRAANRRCAKPERDGGSFARLRGWLWKAVDDPRSLTGREVGMIRLILARRLAKRGIPDSAKDKTLRAQQERQVAALMNHEVASIVERRLAGCPQEGGLETLDEALEPITSDEARAANVAAGGEIPESLIKKIARCLSETAEVLVEKGIITSGETLARVIPQFTSGLRAAAFAEADLQRLYGALDRAFRRRRSLLLLNLESQVRMNELPWVAALERFRQQDLSSRALAARAFREIAAITLRVFPQTIVPNKLLQEFQALAKSAGLDVPLVDELAADIFMDNFSPIFTAAAKRAAALLEGSLYARYFALDSAAIRALPDAPMAGWLAGVLGTRERAVNALVKTCIERAGLGPEEGRDTVRNGMIIEQAQILTTQNLAVLFEALDLGAALRPELRGMAETCFRWICRRQQVKNEDWHAKLIVLKNTAYAWRQMIFYLSQLSGGELQEFMRWGEEHFREQPEEFRKRFGPAWRGLVSAAEGKMIEDTGGDGRRFLGWTKPRHWLLGEAGAGASHPAECD